MAPRSLLIDDQVDHEVPGWWYYSQETENLEPRYPREARRHKSKRVRFEDQVCVKLIPTLDEYSIEEIYTSFLARSDYDCFRYEILETLHLISNPHFNESILDPNQICTWQMEEMLSEAARENRKRLRTKSKRAVFREQDLQQHADSYCDDLISIVYIENGSEDAAEAAFARGLDNARVVQQENGENFTSCCPLVTGCMSLS